MVVLTDIASKLQTLPGMEKPFNLDARVQDALAGLQSAVEADFKRGGTPSRLFAYLDAVLKYRQGVEDSHNRRAQQGNEPSFYYNLGFQMIEEAKVTNGATEDYNKFSSQLLSSLPYLNDFFDELTRAFAEPEAFMYAKLLAERQTPYLAASISAILKSNEKWVKSLIDECTNPPNITRLVDLKREGDLNIKLGIYYLITDSPLQAERQFVTASQRDLGPQLNEAVRHVKSNIYAVYNMIRDPLAKIRMAREFEKAY